MKFENKEKFKVINKQGLHMQILQTLTIDSSQVNSNNVYNRKKKQFMQTYFSFISLYQY